MKTYIKKPDMITLEVWIEFPDGRQSLLFRSMSPRVVVSVLRMARAMIKARAPGWC